MIKRILLSLFVAILSSYGAGHAANYTESIIPVDFTDISESGSPLYLGDDNVSGSIPIGFDFDFYGVRYSTLYVSSNGFLTFLPGQGSACCSGQPIPQAGYIKAFIAAAWTDLHPGRGGSVRFATTGAPGSRVFILMYLNVPHYSGGVASTFNIKLFEGTNRIETHIVTASTAGRTVTVGIENQDGSEGIQPTMDPPLSPTSPMPTRPSPRASRFMATITTSLRVRLTLTRQNSPTSAS
jgi:hypothetical protein